MDFNLLVKQWPLIVFVLLCVVTAILVFYFLYFFIRLGIYEQKEKEMQRTLPVSVVISARDEAANLTQNLPGVLVQDYPTTHEVIVVNDNSMDESKYILDALKKEFKQLHIIELTQEAKMIPGKKFPLSMGIRSAKYETVLLTDADCVPASEHWIYHMQHAYDEHTEVVLGYGAYFRKKGFLNKLIRWETFTTALQYFSYALAGTPYMGVGRNLSYKKGLFIQQKGFSAHHKLPGGDDDLFINAVAHKRNTKICINPEAFTLSAPPSTWAAWMRQKSRHYSTSKYYRPKHQYLLGLYAMAQFLFYPLLIVSAIFYNWKFALGIYALKLLIAGLIYFPAMKKLKENDLFFLFPIFDVWSFFYYIIFAPALIKKPRVTWN